MDVNQAGQLFQVASFVGENSLGNQHLVSVNPRFSSPFEKKTWLEQAGDMIVVLLFVQSGRSPRVEFHQLGHGILRCGSGSLAAAQVLFQLGYEQVDALITEAGPLRLRRQDEWLGYGARGLPRSRCEEPVLWQSVVDQAVTDCWTVGGEQDYLLIELTSEAALKQLMVDTDALSRSSGRALIATAVADTPGFDYVLRYFAPQRGKAEDPATGSANLQLASFWQTRLGKNWLKGRQLSTEGGEFLVEITDEVTWVMGRTKLAVASD